MYTEIHYISKDDVRKRLRAKRKAERMRKVKMQRACLMSILVFAIVLSGSIALATNASYQMHNTLVSTIAPARMELGIRTKSISNEYPEHPTTTSAQTIDIQAQMEEVTAVIDEPIEPEIIVSDSSKYYDIPLSIELQQYVFDKAAEYNYIIPAELELALLWQESRFDPNASSVTNDYGIAQINECNINTLIAVGLIDSREDLFNPYKCIDCSFYLLNDWMTNYRQDNWNTLLMSYNLGYSQAKNDFWANGIYSTPYSRDIVAYASTYLGIADTDIKF